MLQIGYIKSPARKGDRVTVYFPNGRSDRFVANNDLTSTKVAVIGERVFSEDIAQQKLSITTKLFKSKANYQGGGKYPFLSVFINSNLELVSTYNGSQRILGELPFAALSAVNLNHFGNGKFTGIILSQDKTQIVRFDQAKLEPVVNIPFDSRYLLLPQDRLLSGNVVWDKYSLGYGMDFQLTPQIYPSISNRILDNPDSAFASNAIDGRIVSIGNPRPHGFYYDGNTYSYTDHRTVLGDVPGGYAETTIAWDFSIRGGYIDTPISFYQGSSPHLGFGFYPTPGTIAHNANKFWRQDWDGSATRPATRSDEFNNNFEYASKVTRRGFAERRVENDTNIVVSGGISITSGRFGYSDLRVLTGKITNTDTRSSDYFYEYLNPVVICDRRTLKNRIYAQRSENVSFSAEANVSNYYLNTVFDIESEDKYDSTTKNENESILFVFNVGSLGIYLELHEILDQVYDDSTNSLNGTGKLINMGFAVSTPQPSDDRFVRNNVIPDNIASTSTDSNEVNNIYTLNAANIQYYKIAYFQEDDPDEKEDIIATAGYAGFCSNTQAALVYNFFLDSQASSNITLDLTTPYRQQLDFLVRETRTVTNSGAKFEANQTYIDNIYNPLPVMDARGFDLGDRFIIVKQTYQNNIYLALCKVKSTVFNDEPRQNSRQGVYRNTWRLNCEILSVKKIKSFFITQSFIFTVDGCAIFQYLDPYKTNLITVENGSTDPDVYLAATVVTNRPPLNKPVVTEQDTQALLFKLTETGFSFVAVVGGDISDSSQEKSPDAAYWIKYWDLPVTSFF